MTDAHPERPAATGAGESGEGALDSLYENAPCGYLSTSAEGVILRVNTTFLRWTGYDRDEVVGVPFTSLLSIGSQLFYETRFLSVVHLSGEAREVALSLKTATGTVMPILVNATTVRGPDGRTAIIRTAIFDSTGRADYERELLAARRLAEASEFRVRLLQDASSTFVEAATEKALADDLARSARSAFAATSVAVRILDSGGAFTLVSGSEVLKDTTPEADAVRTGTAISLSRKDLGPDRYPGLAVALRRARIESLTVVPIMDEDVPLGVVTSYFGRARVFDANEIDLQLALARQAAQLLTRLRLQKQLERLALYDQLTGLANRKLVREHFGETLEETARNGRDMALIFVDVDGFKTINDEFGHAVGDNVLREIGERLGSVVRGNDLVGRFGGDEFVIICADADPHAVERITDRLREILRTPMLSHPRSGAVTTSVGVALVAGPLGKALTIDEIFEAADAAMYRSKRAGKDRVTVVELE